MKLKHKRFRDFVMRFSFQERRKAKLENFRKELSSFRTMDEEELYFEYVNEKIKDEYLGVKLLLFFWISLIAFPFFFHFWG